MKFQIFRLSKGAKIFLSLILVLVLIRALLPILGKHYINHVLKNNLESYTGSIEDFDLSLLKGEYQLEGLRLYKKAVRQRSFVTFVRADIGIDWKNLFQGRVVARIELHNVVVQMVDSKAEEAQQFGNEEKVASWKKTLDDIVPLAIERVKVYDSKILFYLKDVKGFEANSLSEINGVIESLVTIQSTENNLSPLVLRGKMNGHAPLEIKGGINIEKEPMAFNISLKLDQFNLSTTNKLLRYYVPIDITRGIVTVDSQMKGDLNQAEGSASLRTENLDVISDGQEYLGVKHFFYELAAGFFNWIADIATDGTYRTRIPMQIKDGSFEFQLNEAADSTLKNTVDDIKKNLQEE